MKSFVVKVIRLGKINSYYIKIARLMDNLTAVITLNQVDTV